ncbi:MAG: hypothetical protein WC369_07035, partial [Dehalococcoidales bacterium]
MDKEYILREIDRTAKENNGIPLGKGRFEKETGIRYSDWYGIYWTKWSDALIEKGYPPNKMNSAYDENLLIEQVITFIREIGKFPTAGELRLKGHNSASFPNVSTIYNRLGNKHRLAAKIISYCERKPEYSDITDICSEVTLDFEEPEYPFKESNVEYGYVYLMRFQRVYKIGSSKNVERRNYELGTKLPEDLKIIKKSKTDDP